MNVLTITKVAKQFGLRASALRYYEQVGVLPVANRTSGRRSYDRSILARLAIVQRSRQLGFTLEEIRELFSGFHPGTPASQRWQQLSKRKLTELEAALERINTMKDLLNRMATCQCDALDECGAWLLSSLELSSPARPLRRFPARRVRRRGTLADHDR